MKVELQTKHKTITFRGRLTKDLKGIEPVNPEPEICNLLDRDELIYAKIGDNKARRYRVESIFKNKFILGKI